MPKRLQQLDMLPKNQLACGGELRNKRKGRGARVLSTKESMHLVLRSTLARGLWSFRRHDTKIKITIKKYSDRYGVKLISLANAGNHLHMQIQLTNRHTYKAFIRALTSALALVVTGAGWKCSIVERARELGIDIAALRGENASKQFWDYRPFTRIVRGFKAFLTLKDYIYINFLEGYGSSREEARVWIAAMKNHRKLYSG